MTPSPHQPLRGVRVLVVDDNQDQLEILRSLLAHALRPWVALALCLRWLLGQSVRRLAQIGDKRPALITRSSGLRFGGGSQTRSRRQTQQITRAFYACGRRTTFDVATARAPPVSRSLIGTAGIQARRKDVFNGVSRAEHARAGRRISPWATIETPPVPRSSRGPATTAASASASACVFGARRRARSFA
jgi:hypothetical protein